MRTAKQWLEIWKARVPGHPENTPLEELIQMMQDDARAEEQERLAQIFDGIKDPALYPSTAAAIIRRGLRL